jgi:hypothetical protein
VIYAPLFVIPAPLNVTDSKINTAGCVPTNAAGVHRNAARWLKYKPQDAKRESNKTMILSFYLTCLPNPCPLSVYLFLLTENQIPHIFSILLPACWRT